MIDEWDTNIGRDIIKPIAIKAINEYGDSAINKDIEVEIDGHRVKLVRNSIIDEKSIFHLFMFPHLKGATVQVNVFVEPPNTKRWYVNIFHKFDTDEWIHEDVYKEKK